MHRNMKEKLKLQASISGPFLLKGGILETTTWSLGKALRKSYGLKRVVFHEGGLSPVWSYIRDSTVFIKWDTYMFINKEKNSHKKVEKLVICVILVSRRKKSSTKHFVTDP